MTLMRYLLALLTIGLLAGCSSAGNGSSNNSEIPANSSFARRASSVQSTSMPAAPIYVLHNTRPAWLHGGGPVLVGIYADNGTSVSYRVGDVTDNSAQQVAVDALGRLYVLNSFSTTASAVAVYSPWGRQLRYTISVPGRAYNIALDGSRNLYVQYLAGGAGGPEDISVYAPGSTTALRTIQLAGTAEEVVAPSGTIYAAAYGSGNNAQITVYPAGHAKPSYSFTIAGPNPYVWSLQTDQSSNFYVTNLSPNILEYAPGSTTPTRTLTTGSEIPHLMSFDSNGNLYASDSDGTILHFQSGSTTPSARSPRTKG